MAHPPDRGLYPESFLGVHESGVRSLIPWSTQRRAEFFVQHDFHRLKQPPLEQFSNIEPELDNFGVPSW